MIALSKYKIIPAIKPAGDNDEIKSDNSSNIDYPWSELSMEVTKSRQQRRQDFILICDKFLQVIILKKRFLVKKNIKNSLTRK